MTSPRELAIAFRHAQHDLICDRVEPWAHGTHVRASRFPTYYDFNCLRLEHGRPGAAELLAAADRLLCDLDHRRIEVEDEALGDRLREDFRAAGWRAEHLLWMVIEGEPDAPEGVYEEVAFRDIRPLRAEWDAGFSREEIEAFWPVAEEVAERLGCRTFVALHEGRPSAFSHWSLQPPGAEVRLVYTTPQARGRGLARMLVGASVRAAYAAGAEYAVIVADDDDSPKELYERVGFRPAWRMWELTRRPTDASP